MKTIWRNEHGYSITKVVRNGLRQFDEYVAYNQKQAKTTNSLRSAKVWLNTFKKAKNWKEITINN